MKLAKFEITVTKEEAMAIATKLLDGVDIANTSPDDATTLVGLTFAAAGGQTGPNYGNSSGSLKSSAAQAYLAGDQDVSDNA